MERVLRLTVVTWILVVTALLSVTAVAAPPITFTADVDMTFYAGGTSAACGFDVYVTLRGTGHVILVTDAGGTAVVREIDWNSGWTVTYTAPSLGTSYTQRQAGPFITWYPEGTEIGDPARAMLVGTSGRIGDDPADSGRIVYQAVVSFVDPTTGIPGIDVLDVVSASGSFHGGNLARRCASLAGP